MDATAQSPPEWRLGPYRVLREIGRGGMGRVFLAARADDQFQRLVAIKIAAPEALSGADLQEREMALRLFRFERQTLAGLDHPNCVKLLDGGTTPEGLPYLVMDYVEGQPVTDYCKNQRLPLRDRVLLMLRIASAVQYAHLHMIVHGDIKPANILVTPEGTPKLLDFGISRLMGAGRAGHLTNRFHSSALSLAYASPEQVRGEPPSVSSDVYSLGILLFELLTERYPYPLAEPTSVALAYAITESPATPAGIDPELDAVIGRAIAKNPQVRYSSVQALTEDLGRWLSGFPVSALPDTPAYRARKLVARHPGASILAIAAIVLIGLGVVGIVWQAWVARRAEQRAEARFQQVHDLASSFLFELNDAVQDLPGSTSARLMIVRKASQYLEWLSRDVNNEASEETKLHLDLAEAFVRLGDVQGNPYVANVGDLKAARQSYDRAVTLAQGVLARDPKNGQAKRALALALEQRGSMSAQSSPREGLDDLRKSTEIFEELARDAPVDLRAQMDCAQVLETYGDALGHPGLSSSHDMGGARALYEKAMQHWERVVAIDTSVTRARRARGVLTMKLGDLALNSEDINGSLVLYRKALEYLPDENDPNNKVGTRRAMSMLHRKIAYAVSYGDSKAALEEYAKAVAITEELARTDPNDTRLLNDLAIILRDRGELREGDGDTAGAIADYTRVLENSERLRQADPGNLRRREMTSEMHMRLGRILAGTGQTAEARRQTTMGLDLGRQLAEDSLASSREFIYYAESLLRAMPEDLRRPAEGARYAEKASTLLRDSSAQVLQLRAEAAHQLGDKQHAVEFQERALALIPAGSPARGAFERNLKAYRGE